MPRVKVNGIQVEVPPGTNMIEAARLVGVDIPHYCYHPHLPIAGNCRMCLVDVEAGGRGPDIACNMQARDGLAIRTDTERVRQMRKAVMEFLLANHPLDCPICDQSGECRLQDYYMEHAGHDSRLADPKVRKKKRQDIGDLIVLDAERCVACSRCVRFGDHVTGTGELRLFNRADHTEIGVFPGTRLQHHYQGCLADICPVGALTSKDFRFRKRVWYLRSSPSVCDGCATGCNIHVDHENGEVFRFRPRRNDAVNKSWMCDFGRLSYKRLGRDDRFLGARVDGRLAEFEDALDAAAGLLRDARGALGVVLGARATCEANWAAARLARHLGARLFRVEGNDPDAPDYHDDILVDADKNPNARGVALVAEAAGGGLAGGDALRAALEGGEIRALLVVEDDAVGRLGGLPGGAAVVYLGGWPNATSKAARVVLPVAAAMELDGSYVNRSGRVQRLRPAVPPPGDCRPAHALLAGLGERLGAGIPAHAAALFAGLATLVPALHGLTLDALGDEGRPLGAGPAPADPPTATP